MKEKQQIITNTYTIDDYLKDNNNILRPLKDTFKISMISNKFISKTSITNYDTGLEEYSYFKLKSNIDTTLYKYSLYETFINSFLSLHKSSVDLLKTNIFLQKSIMSYDNFSKKIYIEYIKSKPIYVIPKNSFNDYVYNFWKDNSDKFSDYLVEDKIVMDSDDYIRLGNYIKSLYDFSNVNPFNILISDLTKKDNYYTVNENGFIFYLDSEFSKLNIFKIELQLYKSQTIIGIKYHYYSSITKYREIVQNKFNNRRK